MSSYPSPPFSYANAENTIITDGVWFIPTDPGNAHYQRIVAEEVPIAPYVEPPSPAATSQLWQLRAIMPPDQWAAMHEAIASMRDPVVSAFFAYGTNSISSASETLLSIGQAIGLTAEEVADLVKQASQVSIP